MKVYSLKEAESWFLSNSSVICVILRKIGKAMTLKAWVVAFAISALIGFHVHWHYEREGQKVVEYRNGYAAGVVWANKSMFYNPGEVIVNGKRFEIVSAYQ